MKDADSFNKCSFRGGKVLYPIRFFSTFDFLVPSEAAGKTLYFGCGTPYHCTAGMKVAIPVLA